MKMLIVALALASAPVMAADTTSAPTNNAETRWHPGHDRGRHWGWDHGRHWGWEHHHRWHRPYRCGPFGMFWCGDTQADNAAE